MTSGASGRAPRMEPSNLVIELVQERHVDGFRRAVDLVAREKKYLARTEAPPLPDTIAFINENIRNGNAHYLAVVDGVVVGWCDIVPMKKEVSSHCGVLGMGVVEAYRGRGIGLKLIRAALGKAKANGLRRVELEVFHSNATAIALYQKVGFEIEGRKRRAAILEGAYLDTIQMALFLDEDGKKTTRTETTTTGVRSDSGSRDD
jgi:ribosomal protein S18 acetylase RimI-like enzyme